MVNHRFHSDEEYFNYIGKGEKQFRITMTFAGSVLASLCSWILIMGVLDFYKITILSQGQSFLIFATIGCIIAIKLVKTGFIKKGEEKAIANAKKRLERKRATLNEKGADYLITRQYADMRFLIKYSAFAFFISISLLGLPLWIPIYINIPIATGIGVLLTWKFIKTATYEKIVTYTMIEFKKRIEEGYFYSEI